MKISQREKIMLSILGIIIVGILYYQFVYIKQTSTIVNKTKEKNEVEEKYTTSMNTINSMANMKSNIKILKTKIDDRSSKFYPTISQEHLILEMDKLLKDSGIDGGLTFEPLVVGEVEKLDKFQSNLKESTITAMAEDYNKKVNEAIVGNGLDKKSNSSPSKDSKENTSDKEKETKSNDAKNNEKVSKNEVEQLKCELNFKGNYTDLNKFLNLLSSYERKIVVNSISISQQTLDGLTGTMLLEIYAIPKINDDLEKYLKWNLNNTYGKSIPFSSDASVGNAIKDENKVTNDFTISLTSNTSVLPTVMIGKSDDREKDTYVYADSNNEEVVDLVLTKVEDKYYYKYKTSNGCYPVKYEEQGVEFIPISDNININVLSESRVNKDDKSGMKINITNNTDKLANIVISNDDKQNSRVKVDGDSDRIKITK